MLKYWVKIWYTIIEFACLETSCVSYSVNKMIRVLSDSDIWLRPNQAPPTYSAQGDHIKSLQALLTTEDQELIILGQ